MKKLAVWAGFCALATCYSAEYHVSPKGSDANDGSQGAAWQTIGRAMAAAAPGDNPVCLPDVGETDIEGHPGILSLRFDRGAYER